MLTRSNFTLEGDLMVFPGIDFGYDVVPKLIARKGDLMVTHTPGGSYSSCRTIKYGSSEWHLIRVMEYEGTFTIMEVLKEIEPKHQWRKAKKELIALMEEQ